MKLEELKKSLWGYQKEGVYRYVAEMEREFSQRLLEKDDQARQLETELRSRIEDLERQLCAAQEACEQYRKSQDAISSALLSAQTYADQMREETMRQEEEARLRVADWEAGRERELDAYGEAIQRLRKSLQEFLAEMDGQAQQHERAFCQLRETPVFQGPEREIEGPAPSRQVMTLFQRSVAQGE